MTVKWIIPQEKEAKGVVLLRRKPQFLQNQERTQEFEASPRGLTINKLLINYVQGSGVNRI